MQAIADIAEGSISLWLILVVRYLRTSRINYNETEPCREMP